MIGIRGEFNEQTDLWVLMEDVWSELEGESIQCVCVFVCPV